MTSERIEQNKISSKVRLALCISGSKKHIVVGLSPKEDITIQEVTTFFDVIKLEIKNQKKPSAEIVRTEKVA